MLVTQFTRERVLQFIEGAPAPRTTLGTSSDIQTSRMYLEHWSLYLGCKVRVNPTDPAAGRGQCLIICNVAACSNHANTRSSWYWGVFRVRFSQFNFMCKTYEVLIGPSGRPTARHRVRREEVPVLLPHGGHRAGCHDGMYIGRS